LQYFIIASIKWFQERTLALFKKMNTLDVRRYSATLLHPKYRLLNNCTENERTECHKYIREQLNLIRSITTTSDNKSAPLPTKKFKKTKSFSVDLKMITQPIVIQ